MAEGKASGAFLRAWVAIEIAKPVRHGVLLRMNKQEEPRWFPAQYERLPYICFHCGLLGHSDMECPTPAPRNADGKLPYDVNLRAPEEKKRQIQSFAAAAAESFGSGSSSGFRHSGEHGRSTRVGSNSADGPRQSESRVGDSEEQECQSPLKEHSMDERQMGGNGSPIANRQLFFQANGDKQKVTPKKRKSKPHGRVVQTPNLNIPLGVGSNAIVVKSEGLSGGLVLLWRQDVVVEEMSKSRSHIDVLLSCDRLRIS